MSTIDFDFAINFSEVLGPEVNPGVNVVDPLSLASITSDFNYIFILLNILAFALAGTVLYLVKKKYNKKLLVGLFSVCIALLGCGLGGQIIGYALQQNYIAESMVPSVIDAKVDLNANDVKFSNGWFKNTTDSVINTKSVSVSQTDESKKVLDLAQCGFNIKAFDTDFFDGNPDGTPYFPSPDKTILNPNEQTDMYFNMQYSDVAKLVQLVGMDVFTVHLTVNQDFVNNPQKAETLTYNGKEQTAFETVDGCTLEGDVKATAVNTYTVKGKLQEGYKWWDGTEEDKTFTWSIVESDQQINASAKTESFDYDGQEHSASVDVIDVPEGYVVDQVSSSATIQHVADGSVTAYVDVLVIKNLQGSDVTDKLNINYSSGTLSVNPANLSVYTPSAQKVYDSEPLTKSEGAYVNGFVGLESAPFVVTGSQTMPGSSTNTYDILWDDSSSTAVQTDYSISENLGTLTVFEGGDKVYVTPEDGSFTYDGHAHSVKISVVNIPVGCTLIEASSDTSVTHVSDGIQSGGCDNLVIVDAEGKDVTGSLDIVYGDDATVQITPCNVTVKFDTKTKVYDGEDLSADANDFQIINKPEDDNVVISTESKRKVVGESDVAYSIKWEDSTPKEGDYSITNELGKLVITKYEGEIEVYAGTYSSVYTGLPQLFDGETGINWGDAKGFDAGEISVSGTATHVAEGTQEATPFVQIFDVEENDVTADLNLKITKGSITITPKELTVTTPSASKPYDGLPLTKTDGSSITGFVNNESAILNVIGSQTEPGWSFNTYSIQWTDAIETDYTIDEHLGTLTVFGDGDKVYVTPQGGTFPYDGKEHSIEILVSNLPEGCTVEEAYSDKRATHVSDGPQTGGCVFLKIVDGAGKDITEELEYEYGEDATIQIIPREVTIKADDKTKVYDGESLSVDPTDFEIINKPEDDDVVISSDSEVWVVTDPVSITYSIDWNASTPEETDYSITDQLGTLTITQYTGTIDVYALAVEHTYTGQPQIYDGETGIEFPDDAKGFTPGEITATGSATHVSESPIEVIPSAQIFDVEGNDVAGSLNLNVINGSLSITPAVLTVTTQSDSKPWDGTPLTHIEDASCEGFVNGESVDFTVTGSQTDVGSTFNTYDINWTNAQQSDYTIEENLGTLTVYSDTSDLKVKIVDESFGYDGSEHSPKITILDLSDEYYVDEEETKYTGEDTYKNAGSNTITPTTGNTTVIIRDVNTGEDVTDKLEIAYLSGTITINPATLTVTTGSATKVYDESTPLTNPEGTISGFVNGESATLNVVGERLVPGESENDYEISWDNADKDNYQIEEHLGMLIVLDSTQTINVDGRDETFTYNGTPQYLNIDVTNIPSGYYLREASSNTYLTHVDDGPIYGRCDNLVIVDCKGNDRTDKLNIVLTTGVINMVPCNVSVETKDVSKFYDGEYLEADPEEDVIIHGKPDADEVKIQCPAKRRVVGEVDNTYNIVWSESTPNASDYNIVENIIGKLQINQWAEEIKVILKDTVRDYTGYEQIPDYDVDWGDAKGYYFGSISTDNTFTDACTEQIVTPESVEIYDVEFNLMKTLNIKFVSGKLTIKPATLHVETYSVVKEATGSDITAGGTYWGLQRNETIDFKVTGHAKEPGEVVDNTYVINWDTPGYTAKQMNYEIDENVGTITVLKYESGKVNVYVNDESIEYDGKAHVPTLSVENLEDFNPDYHVETAKILQSQAKIDYGTYNYTISLDNIDLVIKDSNDQPVTSLCEFAFHDGTLNITKRHIKMISQTEVKEYDGTYLENHEITFEDDKGFAEGDGADYVFSPVARVLDNGEATNEFEYYLWAGTSNLNYEIEKEYGILVVYAAVLTAYTPSATKTYDGTELTASEGAYLGGLVAGETATINVGGSQTLVGESSNYFTIEWGTAKESNYYVDDQSGTLTVNEYSGKIVINSLGGEIVYDGQPHYITAEASSLPPGYILKWAKSDVCVTHYSEGPKTGGCTDWLIEDLQGNPKTDLDVEVVSTSIRIVPRPVTIEVKDHEKIYDGEILEASPEDVVINNKAPGDEVVVECSTWAQVMGDTKIEYKILWDESTPEQFDYNITSEKDGYLKILKNENWSVTITPYSVRSAYNGLPQTSSEYNVVWGDAKGFHVGEITTTGYATDVTNAEGIPVNVDTCTILDVADNDVTNYITCNFGVGNIRITPASLEVITNSLDVEWTGETFDAGGEVKGLQNGETVGFETTTVTEVTSDEGILNNYTLDWTSGTAKQTNYEVTKESKGRLIVRPWSEWVYVKVVDDNIEYDGQEHTPSIEIDNCPIAYNVVQKDFNPGLEIKDAKKYTLTPNENNTTIKIEDGTGQDITGSLKFRYFTGDYTINKRSMTIISASDEKTYDGKPFVNENYTIKDGKTFPAGEGITDVTFSKSITNVGTIDNEFSFTLQGGTKDSNYDITKELGTLTVNKAPLVIETASASKVYDGEPLTKTDGTTFSGIVEGEEATMTVTGTQTVAGNSQNSYSINWIKGDPNNYDIQETLGTLTVVHTVEFISVIAGNQEYVYDGMPHYLAITVPNLPKGYRVTVADSTANAMHVDDGVVSGRCDILQIVDCEDQDVTKDLKINYVDGTVKITTRQVTVTTPTLSKIYDGQYLITDPSQIEIENKPVNDVLVIDCPNKIRTAQTINNTFAIDWEHSTPNIDDYALISNLGTLTITHYADPIEVGLKDSIKEYNGDWQMPDPYVDWGDAPSDAYSILDIHTDHYGRDVEDTFEKQIEIIKVFIYDVEGNEVSDQLNLVTPGAKLTISKANLYVQTDSITKEWTGEKVTAGGRYWGLKGKDTIDFEVDGGGIAAKSYVNTYTIHWNSIRTSAKKSNYEIFEDLGTITVLPWTTDVINVYVNNDSVEYDGQLHAPSLTVENVEHVGEGYYLQDGKASIKEEKESLWKKDVATYPYTNLQLEDLDLVICDADGNDVTGSCSFQFFGGMLEIYERSFTVSSKTAEKIYDGTPLFNEDVVYDREQAFVGDDSATFTFSDTSKVVNVGSATNEFSITYNGDTKPENYIIDIVFGELSVTPAPLTVTTSDAEKTYDGEPLVSTSGAKIEGLVHGETASLQVTGVQTLVGSSYNSYILNWGTANSSNYELFENVGTLTVNEYDGIINVIASEKEVVYDGLDHYIEINVAIPKGYIVKEASSSRYVRHVDDGTAVGECDNLVITDIVGNDVTENLNIQKTLGFIKIIPVEVSITTPSLTKVYDGEWLYSLPEEIIIDNKPEADFVKIEIVSAIRDVDSVLNDYFINWEESDPNFTDYNIISENLGYLTITKFTKTITFRGKDTVLTYDGQMHAMDVDIDWNGAKGFTAPEKDWEFDFTSQDVTNGVVNSNLISVKIYDVNGNEQVGSLALNVAFEPGSLQILKAPLYVVTDTIQREYSSNIVKGTGSYSGLVGDETIDFKVTGQRKDVGESANTFEINWDNPEYTAKKKNYEVTATIGKIIITEWQGDINIYVQETECEYDAQPHAPTLFVDNLANLGEGYRLDHAVIIPSYYDDFKDVGTYRFNIDFYMIDILIYDPQGHIYELKEDKCVIHEGYLEITPRKLEIHSKDVTRAYNGEYLTCHEVEFVDGKTFPEGQGIKYKFDEKSKIIDVGVVDNIWDFDWNTQTTNPDNYIITQTFGVLEITPAQITYEAPDQVFTYNGQLQGNPVTATSADEGKTPVYIRYKESQDASWDIDYIQKTDVIELTVYIYLFADNHDDVYSSFTLTINKAVIGIDWEYTSQEIYDGLSILPAKATGTGWVKEDDETPINVKYYNTSWEPLAQPPTEAGNYFVGAFFEEDKTNYEINETSPQYHSYILSIPTNKKFKALYWGASGGLGFYYDNDDHSGSGADYIWDLTGYPIIQEGKQPWPWLEYSEITNKIVSVGFDVSMDSYYGLTNIDGMFSHLGQCNQYDNFDRLHTDHVESMNSLFAYCASTKEVGAKKPDVEELQVPDVSNFVTTNCKDMSYMFSNFAQKDEKKTIVPDVSKFDVSSLEKCEGMFENYALKSQWLEAVPDVSQWQTSSLENCSRMFSSYKFWNTTAKSGCPDLSNWDVTKLQDCSQMFFNYAQRSTEFNDAPNVAWHGDASNFRSINSMFSCFAMRSLALNAVPDVSTWDVSNLEDMGQVFYQYGFASTVLDTVPDVSNWDTLHVKSIDGMFSNYGQYSLALDECPDFSNWKTSTCTNFNNFMTNFGFYTQHEGGLFLDLSSFVVNVGCDCGSSLVLSKSIRTIKFGINWQPPCISCSLPGNWYNDQGQKLETTISPVPKGTWYRRD